MSASLSHSRFHATGRTRPSVDAVWRSGLAASIFSTRRHCTGRSRSPSRSLPNRCRTAVPGRERHVRRRRLDVAGASAAPTVVAATAAAGPPASSAADDDPVGEPVATLDAYEPTIGFPSGSDTATFTNCTVKAACSVNELLPCHDHVEHLFAVQQVIGVLTARFNNDNVDRPIKRALFRGHIRRYRRAALDADIGRLVGGEYRWNGPVDASLTHGFPIDEERHGSTLGETAAVVGKLHPYLMLARRKHFRGIYRRISEVQGSCKYM